MDEISPKESQLKTHFGLSSLSSLYVPSFTHLVNN
jgi:hypothetical protein